MEIAELVRSYLDTILSWPLALIIILLVFRRPLSDLISRLTNIRSNVGPLSVEAAITDEQKKEIDEPQEYPVRTETEIEEYVRTHPKESIEEYQRVFRGYWFERAYNLIFGTQIELLEYLQNKGDRGEKYINLVSFFNKHIAGTINPPQYSDYLGYLLTSKFIEYENIEGGEFIVKITALGVDFLSYIKNQYKLTYKYKRY